MDNITLFAVRPPELRVIQKPSLYHRWFERSQHPVKSLELLVQIINPDLSKSAWIDGVQHVVKMRRAALSDILEYLNSSYDPANGRARMKQFFLRMSERAATYEDMPLAEQEAIVAHGNDQQRLYLDQWRQFKSLFISSTWIGTRSDTHLLPIPVFSNIKPTLAGRFILHLLLSMGDFNNELATAGLSYHS